MSEKQVLNTSITEIRNIRIQSLSDDSGYEGFIDDLVSNQEYTFTGDSGRHFIVFLGSANTLTTTIQIIKDSSASGGSTQIVGQYTLSPGEQKRFYADFDLITGDVLTVNVLASGDGAAQNIQLFEEALLSDDDVIDGSIDQYYVKLLDEDDISSTFVFFPDVNPGQVELVTSEFGPETRFFPNILLIRNDPLPISLLLKDEATGKITESPIAPKLRYYNLIQNSIKEVIVTDPGQGYDSIPTVTVSGGGGFGAELSANIVNGKVKSIDVVREGYGYDSPPVITISSPNEGFTAKAEAVLKDITEDDLTYTKTNGLINRYIPAVEAVFSSEEYVAFYVKNPSQGRYRNIYFWVNGGESINVKTPSKEFLFFESDLLNNDYVTDEYRNSGPEKTSLFGQVKIQHSVGLKNETVDVSSMEDRTFIDASKRLKLPDLSAEEYVPVYLKINSSFDPNLLINKDYSFMHLSYLGIFSNELDSYPGQVYSGTLNLPFNRVLPSIVMEFKTNYDRLLSLIDNNTEKLYENYPPFFSYYE